MPIARTLLSGANMGLNLLTLMYFTAYVRLHRHWLAKPCKQIANIITEDQSRWM